MENLLRPSLGGGAEFQGRGSSLVFELQRTCRCGYGREVLERDLHALIAAEENVAGFQVRLAGERSSPQVHPAFEFLSHRVMPRPERILRICGRELAVSPRCPT